MKRDMSLFSDDFKLEMSDKVLDYDTSHIYTGHIYGEQGSFSHGSVVDGRFEGFIMTHTGTFYIEPAERYIKDRALPFHSVMYHEDDIRYPHKYGPQGGCADHSVFDRMKKYQMTGVEEPTNQQPLEEHTNHGPELLRRKRAAQAEKNTCQLYIQTDHLFFRYYGTREAVIAQISSHVKAIDTIYQSTDFSGIRNISFMVKRIRINTTQDEKDPSNPFRFPNIGVEKFLELNSEQNHDDYCLAYVFTDRDFDDGVLGLAWVGAPSGSSGGICEKSKLYSDGKKKSLNTGIITVQNYGSHVPPKVSHITFAHEVGHNFGSPHDSGTECTPGESKNLGQKENGNYIMYARATSGDKLNNNKFSLCSIRNISQVLEIYLSIFVMNPAEQGWSGKTTEEDDFEWTDASHVEPPGTQDSENSVALDRDSSAPEPLVNHKEAQPSQAIAILPDAPPLHMPTLPPPQHITLPSERRVLLRQSDHPHLAHEGASAGKNNAPQWLH
ncbi:disintegrin and metalloproteinase domain-containing protein 10-like [Rhineura floridana]|uniref:disintegrin and metalloproteinase domain-containing protein 10-like n=1 Tax=Rhineura floridana TaxID=261503 RepID=UPI002AC84CF7|nr:disintegrin and metalloproteinase domain-containing protein 10-like [Rhineura floridana]